MAKEAEYYATPKTLAEGQRANLQVDANGSLRTNFSGTVSSAPKQFTVSTTPSIATANATVFTLAAGEKGIIQNLNNQPLAVRYGASASTTAFTFLLKAGTATDDGTGGSYIIDDWSGAVSVCSMSGTGRYVASKLS